MQWYMAERFSLTRILTTAEYEEDTKNVLSSAYLHTYTFSASEVTCSQRQQSQTIQLSYFNS